MAIFDPIEWVNLSAALVLRADEGSHRTAIGRMYYACHLTARDQLFGIDGVQLKRKDRERLTGNKLASEHQCVSSAVARSTAIGTGRAKRLSDQLTELKSMREQADYFRDSSGSDIAGIFQRYAVSDWHGLAGQAMVLAKALLPELSHLPVYGRA